MPNFVDDRLKDVQVEDRTPRQAYVVWLTSDNEKHSTGKMNKDDAHLLYLLLCSVFTVVVANVIEV